MTLAPSAGYPGGLTPDAWRQQSSFSELLKFWRWLYCLQQQHPLPADFDTSVTTVGRKTMVFPRTVPVADPDNVVVLRTTEPLVADDADRASASAFPSAEDTATIGKENQRCQKCTGVAKFIAKDMKRLRSLQKAHEDLMTAIADRDLARVATILELVG